MTRLSKIVTYTLILALVASSITLIESAQAQSSTPKPAVPEFTIKYFEHPYDVPPRTSVDPYTGKTKTIEEGYHVQNSSIVLTIKNQPFTPFTDSQGNYIGLSYNISVKGSYTNDWKNYYRITAEKGDYTVATFCSGACYNESDWRNFLLDIPSSGEIDFRIKAQIGYLNETVTPFPAPGGLLHTYKFIGETSDWSNTQKLNLDNKSTTTAPPQLTPTPTATVKPSQNPQATPTQPISEVGVIFGFDWEIIALLVAVAVIVVLVGVVVVLWRGRTSAGKQAKPV